LWQPRFINRWLQKNASNTKKSAKNNHFYKEETVPEFKFVQNLKDTKEKKNL